MHWFEFLSNGGNFFFKQKGEFAFVSVCLPWGVCVTTVRLLVATKESRDALRTVRTGSLYAAPLPAFFARRTVSAAASDRSAKMPSQKSFDHQSPSSIYPGYSQLCVLANWETTCDNSNSQNNRSRQLRLLSVLLTIANI